MLLHVNKKNVLKTLTIWNLYHEIAILKNIEILKLLSKRRRFDESGLLRNLSTVHS